MFVPFALVQSPAISADADVSWRRDLTAFDAELAKRKGDFAAKRLFIECKEDVKQILSHLHDLDQFGRSFWNAPHAHGYDGTPAEQTFFTAFRPRIALLDAENLRTFKSLLDRWGWFDRISWGDAADEQAWLLTQHADEDLPFQKGVLTLLEPLVKTGETNPSNFAYLFDRVAVNDHRLQRFGTQGYCTGPGTWTPRPIEDPAHVDERRKAVGLAPLGDYIASFKNICHEDQTELALKNLPLPGRTP